MLLWFGYLCISKKTKMNKLLFCLSLFFFGVSCQENQPKTNVAQAKSVKKYDKNIIFFGNSLTAGYGLPVVSSGFVGLIQKRIDSLGLPYKCVNAGLSGETTAGGAARVDWILQQKVDVFVLELGGNDALRGIDPKISIQNLQTILDKVKAKHPKAQIILAGMQAPRNMGTAYTDAFQAIYPKLAEQNKISLIPFILEGVGGIPSLNQGDGIHPNEAGNKIILENLWKNLQKIVLP
jgi:acyl-CoA thioesterase I